MVAKFFKGILFLYLELKWSLFYFKSDLNIWYETTIQFHFSIMSLNFMMKRMIYKQSRYAFFLYYYAFYHNSRNINQLKLDSILRLDETFIIVAWLSIYFKKAFYLDSHKLHVLNQVKLTKCRWATNHQIQSYINPFYMYMYDLLTGER